MADCVKEGWSRSLNAVDSAAFVWAHRWHSVQFFPLRDRAASDQGPGHSTVLTGSSLHGTHIVPTIDFRAQVLNMFDRRYSLGVPVFKLAQVGHERLF